MKKFGEALKVLVTGGSGFVGSQVVASLKQKGCHVTSVTRTLDRPNYADQHFQHDLNTISTSSLIELLSGYDAIVHMAWPVASSGYESSSANDTASSASVRLAMCALQAKVGSFVGIGTCLEYDTRFGLLDVSTPTGPTNRYGKAKLRTFRELTSLFESSKTRFAWARLFFIFGERDRKHRFAGYVRNQVEQGLPALVKNPLLVRDYSDVRHVGSQLAALALSDIEGAVNICSGRPVSLLELATQIASEVGRPELIMAAKSEAARTELDLIPRIVGVPSRIPVPNKNQYPKHNVR